ncbi:AI-2E family transporter [Myroides ceti]|uniref:AI-2E family transporter n=1 Tax=Paenimyroides ceti TaxID=395087 RepID=A0ABT8CWP6_9FLAO|nr:AI-2E family transporter [Paenimyroides ceti]MDN3707587.1 AI-2E family transporter [Paenimyroides ceti]
MKPHHKQFISNNVLLQLGFLAIIIFLFILMAKSMMILLPGFLGAICLFVLLLTPYRWLVEKKNWNKIASIILLMLSSAIVIIGPLYLLIQTLTKKIMVLLDDKQGIQGNIDKAIENLQTKFNIDLFNDNNIGKMTELGIKLLESVLNASVNSSMQLAVAYFLLYFMLLNHQKLEKGFYDYVPLKKTNLKRMNTDLKELVISNAVGVPLTAFLQAVVAYIGYIVFGVEDSFVYFILTIFAAMLPVLGAAIIYIPLVVILLAKGDTGNAFGLLAYSLIIVGLADNFIRFLLQKKMADVHPLVTILGVIVGINLFGFIGIIFGPILFSLFLWLIKLYKYEFVNPNPE